MGKDVSGADEKEGKVKVVAPDKLNLDNSSLTGDKNDPITCRSEETTKTAEGAPNTNEDEDEDEAERFDVESERLETCPMINEHNDIDRSNADRSNIEFDESAEEYTQIAMPTDFDDVTNNSDETQTPISSVGDLFVALGNPGRMAIVLFLGLSFNVLITASNHMIGVFFGYTPEHQCRPDLGATWNQSNQIGAHFPNGTTPTGSVSLAAWYNRYRHVSYEACHVTFSNASRDVNVTHDVINETRWSCGQGQWRYQLDDHESSVVTEWDLVCQSSYLSHLANTCYYVGVTIGGFTVAYVSDTFGRKPAILLCLYSLAGLGLGIVFTHVFLVFVCLRTLIGLAAQALLITSYIQTVEMVPPDHRAKAGTGMYIMWGMGMVYLGVMAWALKEWRHIQLACTVPAMLSAVYLLWMPESLRWLLSQGNTKKAMHVAKRIYKFNGATDKRCLDPKMMAKLSSKTTDDRKSLVDLCSSPTLRRNTIIFSTVACFCNMGYWGISYSTTSLNGDRYLNFLLGAIAELIIMTLNVYIVNRFGRKKPMIFYLSLGGACCVTLAFLPRGSNAATTAIIATMGRLALSGLFSASDLYAVEMFPTVVRTTGVGICVLAGRLGAMITPQIFTLGDLTFRQLPLIIFGATSLTGALLVMLLPETQGRPLCDTIKEAEASASTHHLKVKDTDLNPTLDVEVKEKELLMT